MNFIRVGQFNHTTANKSMFLRHIIDVDFDVNVWSITFFTMIYLSKNVMNVTFSVLCFPLHVKEGVVGKRVNVDGNFSMVRIEQFWPFQCVWLQTLQKISEISS